MKYGNGLSSRGGSIVRKLILGFVILAKVRGTVRTKSVCVSANTRIAPGKPGAWMKSRVSWQTR